MNTVVSKFINSALTNALLEEIALFKSSEGAKLLNEETFDPLSNKACFLGQSGQQGLYGSQGDYREKIGRIPYDYGLASFNNMTPLEIWSAYYWTRDKELVLNVLRYIKGENDTLPEVVYAEVKEA